MWTQFYDLYSGGGRKTDYDSIYIELPENEAIEYFKSRFYLDPYNVTCSCCGSDFAVYEEDEIPTYLKGVLIITKKEIDESF